MDIELRITTKTILIAILAVLGLWLVVQLKVVLLILCGALFLALGLAPIVDFLNRQRIPYGLASFLTVGALTLLFLGSGALGFSSILEQTRRFTQKFPQMLDSLAQSPTAPEFVRNLNRSLAEQLGSLSGNVFQMTKGAFSGLTGVVSVLFFTFYLLLYLDSLRKQFLNLFSSKKRDKVRDILDEVETSLGKWLRGQFTLMVCVGLLTFISLSVLRVEYALSLALLAGAFEIVPTFGPIFSAVPAILVGFSISPAMGFAILGLFAVIQQLENNLIVPKVMEKAIDFNPLMTMLVILVGGKLLGFVGILISVPLALVGKIVLDNL